MEVENDPILDTLKANDSISLIIQNIFIRVIPILCPDQDECNIFNTVSNKTLGRALDPRANGTWLSKLTE